MAFEGRNRSAHFSVFWSSEGYSSEPNGKDRTMMAGWGVFWWYMKTASGLWWPAVSTHLSTWCARPARHVPIGQ